MRIASLFTLIFLVLVVGVFYLQYFLSKKENKWLGLVLPIISFFFSLMAALSAVSSVTVSNNGETVGRSPGMISAIIIFLYNNIPTLIFLSIYYIEQEKIKKQARLERMKIEDL